MNSQVSARVANSYAGTMRKAHQDEIKSLLTAAREAWTSHGKKGKEPSMETVQKANPLVTVEAVTKDWDHQTKFDELYAEYVLRESVRGTGEESKTPLERMIDFFAKERAKANILAKGHKVAVFMKTKDPKAPEQSLFVSLVAKVKANYLEELTSQAEEALVAQDLASEEDDGLFDGLELPPEDLEAEADADAPGDEEAA